MLHLPSRANMMSPYCPTEHAQCTAGRSCVEVRNEQETTLNRANGNLTIRQAPSHLEVEISRCFTALQSAACLIGAFRLDSLGPDLGHFASYL